MKIEEAIRSRELSEFCAEARCLMDRGEFGKCKSKICEMMCIYPHAPQPHNLLGVLLEKTGDHSTAMKHFRAAWALDPTYSPAGQNLTTYGTFYTSGKVAYDESDCQQTRETEYDIIYDCHGVGRMVRRK